MNDQTKNTHCRWIDVPCGAYGLTQGPKHGVHHVHVAIDPESAFVGAVSLFREGDEHPTTAIAHIDDDLVVYSSVEVLERALGLSGTIAILKGLRVPPIVACKSVAVGSNELRLRAFHDAVRQTIGTGTKIDASQVIMDANGAKLSYIIYNLNSGGWTVGQRLHSALHLRPNAAHQRAILKHDIAQKGKVSWLSLFRFKMGVCYANGFVDSSSMNCTGADYTRGSVIKAFDLRARRLKGYEL
jgi:hypothetical protein